MYEQTYDKVAKYISPIPGMTITRFYDEAAKLLLNQKQNENEKHH